MSEFRQRIVSLQAAYHEFAADRYAGKGIRPISVESKLKADLLDNVLTIYETLSGVAFFWL
jgi:hypothetical protein